MKKSPIPVILLILNIFIFSCGDMEFNYGSINCSGSVETSETFSKTPLSYSDLGGYDYIFDYTSFTLSIPIEDCCPSKPLKVDFTCHLDASDTTEVFAGLSVYNGLNTQLGSVDLDSK
jgi:hypothetical protein